MGRRWRAFAAGAVVTMTVVAMTLGVMPGGSGSAHAGMVAGTVWVANEEAGSLTVIDASRNRVLTTLTGIDGPHNVQASPDGQSVWAVMGHESRAIHLGTTAFRLHAAVPTGREPAHVIVTPDGRTAYVTNAADDTVTAIDTGTGKPVATIPVGRFPHGLRPSPDGRWVYVANAEGNTVSVLDTSSHRRVTDIPVGAAPIQVAFAPDGRFAYVSLNGEDSIGKIDVTTRTLVGTVAVGDGPIQVFVSPDGRLLLATNEGTAQRPGTAVSIIDTGTFMVSRTVDTGLGPHGVVIDPSGRHAYITNTHGNDVAVLDLAELEVVARIPVGARPNGITYSAIPPSRVPATIRLPVQFIEHERDHADGHGH